MWQAVTTEEVVARLEEAWARHGAFESEAHSVTVSNGRVLLDFVTWWESGNYYTGRIEIEPGRRAGRRTSFRAPPLTDLDVVQS